MVDPCCSPGPGFLAMTLFGTANLLGPLMQGHSFGLRLSYLPPPALPSTIVLNVPFACLKSLYSQHWENAAQIPVADLGGFLEGGYKGWELALVGLLLCVSPFWKTFLAKVVFISSANQKSRWGSICIFVSFCYLKFWPSHPSLLLPYDIMFLFHRGGNKSSAAHGYTLSENCLGAGYVCLPFFVDLRMLYLAEAGLTATKAHLLINPESGDRGALLKPSWSVSRLPDPVDDLLSSLPHEGQSQSW